VREQHLFHGTDDGSASANSNAFMCDSWMGLLLNSTTDSRRSTSWLLFAQLKTLDSSTTEQQQLGIAQALDRDKGIEVVVGDQFCPGTARRDAQQGAGPAHGDYSAIRQFDAIEDIGRDFGGHFDPLPGVTAIRRPVNPSTETVNQNVAGRKLGIEPKEGSLVGRGEDGPGTNPCRRIG